MSDRARPLLIVLIALAAALSSSAPAGAQTGSIDPTPEQLAAMPTFDPDEIELIEQRFVDLRRWMPPVGRQQVNDCTAWAVGYAVRTYLEARDQGWTPDRPERIFSPTFLYNQINRGVDQGSSYIEAIALMMERGAATLARAPYRPQNVTAQPSELAFEEASAFPIYSARRVLDRNGIRRALQRRQPVVFGAHVGPKFFSGQFIQYTAEDFALDRSLRQPDQPHDKHAMVIVGYDDDRGAFLVMNSWGTDWAVRGRAYVDYELFDDIRPDPSGSIYCIFACTLVDVEEPIERDDRGMPRPAPATVDDLVIRGHSDLVRYDPELEKYLYVFTAELNGPRSALADVTGVRWTWIDESGRERTYESDNAGLRFPLLAGTTMNPLEPKAELMLADGSRRTIEGEILGPNPRSDWRTAEIILDDEYAGVMRDGPIWLVKAKLDYPLEQRADIVKVEWRMGEPGRQSVSVVDDFNGSPADQEGGFRAGRPAPLEARVFYNDGGVKTITSDYPEFIDEREDALHLQIDAVPSGRDSNGETIHTVRLALDGPSILQLRIDHVMWTVDPHISTRPIRGFRTFQWFESFVTSTRDFRARAEIHYSDGRTQTLEKWITLDEDSGFDHPERIATRTLDTYLGRTMDGESEWRMDHDLIGDRRTLEQVESVTWRRSAEDWTPEPVVRENSGDATFAVREAMPGERATVTADVRMKDGSTIRIDHIHERSDPVNDVIGLRTVVTRRQGVEALIDEHLVYWLDVSLLGPKNELDDVHRVDFFHTVDGRRTRSVLDTGRVEIGDTLRMRTAFTEPFELEAHLHSIDGRVRVIHQMVSGMTGGEQRPPVTIDLEIEWEGYDGGRPLWRSTASVVQDESVEPREVREVVWSLRTLQRDRALGPYPRAADRPMRFTWREPTEVTATVTWVDGSETVLTATADLWPRRTDDDLTVTTYRVGPWTGHFRHLIVIDGADTARRSVRSIRAERPTAGALDVVSESEFQSPTMFSIRKPDVNAEVTVPVEIGLSDGTTRDYEFAFGPIDTESRLTGRIRHWKDDVWEVETQKLSDWSYLRLLTVGVMGSRPEGTTPAYAWPPGTSRHLREAGTHSFFPGKIRQEQKLSQPEVAVTLDPANLPKYRDLRYRAGRPPGPHDDRSPDEWLLYFDGPESLMSRIASVRYEWDRRVDGEDVPTTWTAPRRWGEFREGFEMAWFGRRPSGVFAIVTMDDGTERTFRGQLLEPGVTMPPWQPEP